MASKLIVVLLAVTTATCHAAVVSEECPCVHREADPLFPGAEGSRWDCEYVNHGLSAVPTTCWSLHPDVTQVFLGYNEITHLDADSFAGLTHLQVLSLSHNKIASVADGTLDGLRSLKFLDMSSNKIVDPPADVWNLVELTLLDLSDNQLTETNNYNIHNLVNLEVLDLHLNHMSEIPHDSLEPLTKLKKLHLYWNMLVDLPLVHENLELEEVLVNGNAILNFPQNMFGALTKPLTYHFVDNPAYDVHAEMLLPLPDHSHIMMGFDVSIWAKDEAQAEEIMNKVWVIQDGLHNTLDLSALLRICPSSVREPKDRLPPC